VSQEQPGIHSKTLSQNKNKKENKEEKLSRLYEWLFYLFLDILFHCSICLSLCIIWFWLLHGFGYMILVKSENVRLVCYFFSRLLLSFGKALIPYEFLDSFLLL
jgi:hypothetical protein